MIRIIGSASLSDPKITSRFLPCTLSKYDSYLIENIWVGYTLWNVWIHREFSRTLIFMVLVNSWYVKSLCEITYMCDFIHPEITFGQWISRELNFIMKSWCQWISHIVIFIMKSRWFLTLGLSTRTACVFVSDINIITTARLDTLPLLLTRHGGAIFWASVDFH